MPEETPKESPVLVLPTNKRRGQQLQRKLKEYEGRLDGRRPELQMSTICKVRVLKLLLQDGKVSTWDLSLQLETEYGNAYFPGALRAFDAACGVIEDYCKTGGKNVSRGTGLK